MPAGLQHGTGFTSILTNTKVTRDQQTRLYFQADSTVYAHGRRRAPDQVRRAGRPRRQQRAAAASQAQPRDDLLGHAAARRFSGGTYGYYSVRSNGVAPEAGLHHRGRHPHEQHRPVRPGRLDDQQQADDQRRPPHRAREGADLHHRAKTCRSIGIEFSFGDKLAPRVGFAYDIKGDGKWKVVRFVGHLLRHLQARTAARLVRRRQVDASTYYTLDTSDWPTLVDGASCPPACPGTLIRGPIDFRHPSFGCGLDRAEPEADEAAGSVVRPRPPAERRDGGQRALRPQAARPRDRRHGLARRRRATRATSSPTPAKA